MSAGPEITLRDLSGEWVMNKTLSDDADPILALQGVGWWTRKAISLATVTLHAKQYTDENGLTHIDIEQTATGGIKGTTELRTLDWEKRSHEDHLFGKLVGQSRWLSTLDEVDDAFLKDGWEENDSENSGPNGERHVQSFVVNEEKGWTANQIWGFAIVDGKRYYTRRIAVTKGDTVLKVRFVYNWQGKK
ncbi:lccl domain-containing protein [Rutstroemia sp. NJR-2017a BBW]|nr:lccl domain-containing protein [Rutstroemia sp. NJR-2017a BBW]